MAHKFFIAIIIVTVTFLLISHRATTLPVPLPHATRFCATANDKSTCLNLVSGATTKEEAMANVVKGTITHVDEMKNVINSLKAEGRDECIEAQKSAIEHLNQALHAIPKGADKFESEISAATFSDCTDALNELGVKSSLVNFNNKYNDLRDSCLTVSQSSKKPSSSMR